jgi:UTP-glucose-1-phosphate uridylyltransferase
MKVVILAAGLDSGTRLLPAIKETPIEVLQIFVSGSELPKSSWR